MEAAIARGLHPAANAPDVDHAVAHHAAIVEEIGGRREPVADVEAEQPARRNPGKRALELGVPPDVIDVDRDAQPRAEFFAQRVGLRHGVDAGAVRRVHRMQRLDCESHPARPRVIEDACDPFLDQAARRGDVLAAFRQPAHDQHQALRRKRRRLVDGAPVLVDRRGESGAAA